jgi:glycosyltransferase involved in cell wall biosynthesis
MSLGKVSVVIPSYNEGENLVDTVRCVLDHASYEDFEVLVVDDGSTDGSGDRVSRFLGSNGQMQVLRTPGLGVAGARNWGAQAARGDILIFLDAHSYTPPGWMASLVSPLSNPQVGMVGPAFASLQHGNDAQGLGVIWRDASLEIEWLPRQGEEPYPVPLLTGGCQVIRRSDFQKLGGYDSGMTRWGSEDQELSLRTWLMGYQLVVQPQAVIYHLFRERHPYPVEESKILYNRLRMALLHLSLDRVGRVIEYHKEMPSFSQSLVLLLENDTMTRRRQLEQVRQRDDSCFFAQFGREI